MTNANLTKGQRVTVLEIPAHKATKYTLDQVNAAKMAVSYVPQAADMSQDVYIKNTVGEKRISILLKTSQIQAIEKRKYRTKKIIAAELKARGEAALLKWGQIYSVDTTVKCTHDGLPTRISSISTIHYDETDKNVLIWVDKCEGKTGCAVLVEGDKTAVILQTGSKYREVKAKLEALAAVNAKKKENRMLIHEALSRYPVGSVISCALGLSVRDRETIKEGVKFYVSDHGNVSFRNPDMKGHNVFVYISEQYNETVKGCLQSGWVNVEEEDGKKTVASYGLKSASIEDIKNIDGLTLVLDDGETDHSDKGFEVSDMIDVQTALKIVRATYLPGRSFTCLLDKSEVEVSEYMDFEVTDLGNIVGVDEHFFRTGYVWIGRKYLSHPQRPENVESGFAEITNLGNNGLKFEKGEPTSPYANPALYETEKQSLWSKFKSWLGFPALLVALAFFASCSKSNDPQPKQVYATYDVTCNICVVNVTDEIGGVKSLPITGKWSYTTNVTTLDSVRMAVGVSATTGIHTKIKSSISINGKVIESRNVDEVGGFTQYGVNLARFK